MKSLKLFELRVLQALFKAALIGFKALFDLSCQQLRSYSFSSGDIKNAVLLCNACYEGTSEHVVEMQPAAVFENMCEQLVMCLMEPVDVVSLCVCPYGCNL